MRPDRATDTGTRTDLELDVGGLVSGDLRLEAVRPYGSHDAEAAYKSAAAGEQQAKTAEMLAKEELKRQETIYK